MRVDVYMSANTTLCVNSDTQPTPPYGISLISTSPCPTPTVPTETPLPTFIPTYCFKTSLINWPDRLSFQTAANACYRATFALDEIICSMNSTLDVGVFVVRNNQGAAGSSSYNWVVTWNNNFTQILQGAWFSDGTWAYRTDVNSIIVEKVHC
jgi:hypothetical protein